MQFAALFRVMTKHIHHRETELRKSMFEKARQAVQDRWVEITEPSVGDKD